MKCALLSNVNVESIARRIERHEVHIAQGYGVWTSELADPTSGTFGFEPSSVFLIIDGAELMRGAPGLETVLANVDEHLAWIERAAERLPDVKFFASTVDVPARTLVPPMSMTRTFILHWMLAALEIALIARSKNQHFWRADDNFTYSTRFPFLSHPRLANY